MKTSAVMIAAGGERGFYRSVQDVPEPLRTQLLETTTSQNSGTIVIADRAGKEQITQVLARREANRERVSGPRTAGEAMDRAVDAEVAPAPAANPGIPWFVWAGVALVLALAAAFAAFFEPHW
jgi:hypothetical protein